MSDPNLDVYEAPGVTEGFCVVVQNKVIIYAGPTDARPKVDGKADVYLNPKDFALLRNHIRSTRH